MEKIKLILHNYRKKRTNFILLKELLMMFSIFLLLSIAIILIESIFYFTQTNREIIFSLFFSLLFASILYISLKWYISINRLFDYNNDLKLAKEIGISDKHIKDTFVNTLQINKINNQDNDDLKQYAALQLLSKLKERLGLHEKFKKPNTHIYLFICSMLLLCLSVLNHNNYSAFNRMINYHREFDVPMPFSLTSLSGSFSALTGDTLDINISGFGVLPDSINIILKTINKKNHTKISHDNQIYKYNVINATESVIYWAEYKSKSFFTPWDEIATQQDTIVIKQRPLIKNISFAISPPKYSNLERYFHDESNINQVQLLKGSTINLEAISSKNLNTAWMLNNDQRISLELDRNIIKGSIDFVDNMFFSIYCLDEELIANLNPMQYSFVVKEDLPPNIIIQSPQFEFELDESLIIPLKINIYDDYGINKVWLEYQIFSQDFPEMKNKINKLNLTIDTNEKQTYINKEWDTNSLNILMGDELHFWIVADDLDNISGPNLTQSSKLIGRFPSLEDLFTRIEETEEDTKDIVEDIQSSIDEISEMTEDIKLELLKSDELSWEQENKLEKSFDEVEKIFEQIENIQENIDNIIEQSDNNNLFDNELLEKFDQFKDMLQEMMTQELLEAMDELQKAFKEMDQEKLMEALQNYEFNIEKFEEELDRFMDMFELALAEQKLNELSEQIENMINKQKDLIEDINSGQDTFVLEKKSIKQENRFTQFQNLLEDTEKQLLDLSDQTSDALNKLNNSELIQETKEELSKQTDELKNHNTTNEMVDENLEEISNMLAEINKGFKNENVIKMTKEFIMIIDNLLTMSNQQEDLIESAKGIRSNHPKIRTINKNQNNIDRELNQVTKQLIELSNQTFFISPKINRVIGQLKNAISRTISHFEQKKISYARTNQLNVLKHINEITYLLLLSMDEMQNSTSMSGFEQFMESLQEMSKQQQGINQGTMNLGQMGLMQQKSMLEQLMQQQKDLKNKLSELLGDMPGENTGGLSKAEQDMEEIINDFQRGEINKKTLERQERILSRMLDSQKSMTQKDYSEKRQSKLAEDTIYKGVDYIPEDLGNKDIFLMNAMESAIDEGLSLEYQKLIRLYFLNLQKEGNIIE